MSGSAFSLGWLMAQLFDARRLTIDELFTTPFDPVVQLPLVAGLDLPRRRQLALADLTDLVATVVPGVPADTVTAAKSAGLASPVDEAAFAAGLQDLHQAIFDQLAGDDPQICGYQLGLTLSDTCWLPTAADGPHSFMVLFQRGQVAALKNWLASAGDTIPKGSAAVIGKSLENWQDWIEVNARPITDAWPEQAGQILKALHIQAMTWHSVLVGDPQTSGAATMNAWIEASTAVVRATRKVTVSVLRRFWPLIAFLLVIITGVLIVVLTSTHGASRVWASVVWVGGSVGTTGLGFRSAVGKAISGIGSEVWSAARTDAAAWNVTWLPAVPLSSSQQRSLDRAGVAPPTIRANLEAAPRPARPAPAPAAPRQ